jgi:ATP-dependent DNA helicase RecG
MEPHESDRLEFKKSLGQMDEALKALCAFLNHKGGEVWFGLDDKGKVTGGLQVSAGTLRKISQQVHQRIRPEAAAEVCEAEKDGRTSIIVKVPEGRNKPYFLDGIAYRRSGSESRAMPPDELKRLILEQRQEKWDEEVCTEASTEDIDFQAVGMFRGRYEEINNTKLKGTYNEVLRSLKCLRERDGKIAVTNAGILLFGKRPEDFVPMSYVTIARYPGNEIGRKYSDIRDFHGRLFDIVDSVDQYVREHMAEASEVVEDRLARNIIPQYPYFAVREIITNAVVHRDYINAGSRIIIRMFTDRMEFSSPGGFRRA